MATWNSVNSTVASTNTTSYASNAFTPTAGSLMVVCVAASDTNALAPTLVSSTGLTFTLIQQANHTINALRVYLFVATAVSVASSQTLTFDCSADAATGSSISVMELIGLNKLGASAVVRTAVQNNAAAGTPAPVYSVAPLTQNPQIGVMMNGTNPAGMTTPSGWTQRRDVGYSNPTSGAHVDSINSGATATTVTWGSASASAFCALVAEFDASVSGTLAATESGSDTAAMTGTVRVAGTLSATESGSDTSAMAGQVRVAGVLAASESGADVAAFAGAVRVAGTLAAAESGADTAAMAGKVLVKGALAATESGSDTASMSGKVRVSGTLAAAESGADTAAMSGQVRVAGVLAAAESGSDTAAFTGTVVSLTIHAVLNAQETGSDTAAFTAILVRPQPRLESRRFTVQQRVRTFTATPRSRVFTVQQRGRTFTADKG